MSRPCGQDNASPGGSNAGEVSGAVFVGVDLGGTNVKVGVVDDHGRSLARVSVPTAAEQGPAVGLQTIFQTIEQGIERSSVSPDNIAAIGVATPGTMDIPAGLMLRPHNLPGWDNLPIRKLIADRFEKQTVLQNDANAAAYGEYWVGAGKEAHSMVLWTLGTGIGCGIIVEGVIIQGEHSHGSECGHLIIEMTNPRPCDSGQFGTLEAYAGAKSLVRRCQQALDAGRASVLHASITQGESLTPLLIAHAAESGDCLANELIMETASCLGIGTTNVMHTIDPNIVLFGGAMTFGRNTTELGRRFLQGIKDEVRARAFPIPAQKTIIDYATLGGNAGYIGAAGCARLQFQRRH